MATTKRQIQSLAQTFKILGDPSRLRIVMLLSNSEMNVSHICRRLRLSQPTVSRHLSILKMSRLAEARRSGKEIFYSLPPLSRRAMKSILKQGENLRK
ncbi:MAG: metalloregulator ArsR/SmtB family transcription factor [Phycisphaerae bacterium]|nr:metalloregulator ArsR/SmtB family transcription factor [Phycisphaerae bacterium]